jgi:ABC-2 type transport system permease protein
MNRRQIKNDNLIQLGLAVAITLLICYIANIASFRFDLTQEKRYTLSPVSKQILKKLDDQILFKVYLEGDIPKGFRQLSRNIRELLDEFRMVAKENIQYQFIDPYENADANALNALVKDLYKKGIQSTNVKIKDTKGGYSEKLVIPGILISYNGIELPVRILSNNPGLSGEENLNNSLQNLEYTLINAIHCITNTKTEKIAFLEGHGELDQYLVDDIMQELANYYQVDRGQINGKAGALDGYKCVIVAQPQKHFSEEDKFVLDQYLMKGGKVLWFIDPVKVDADSLAKGSAVASIFDLNVDDLLFVYGVRINPTLLQDIQCSLIPVNTSLSGTQPKFYPAPWLYYPLLSGNAMHAISRNLNMVEGKYCSYLDTLQTGLNLKKTVILKSSKLSKIRKVPSLLSLSEVSHQNVQSSFNMSYLPVAVLIEGHFHSAFRNRVLSGLKIDGSYAFSDSSVENKMLVVADGDIIKNDYRQTPRGILITPLGFDKYTSQTFGNKDFVLNAVNYLVDDIGLVTLRTREIKLRLLDLPKIDNNRYTIQFINIICPVLLVIFIGIAVTYYRKNKYSV